MTTLWDYFKKQEGKMARCLVCNNEYSYKTSITNLKSHLSTKHIDIYEGIKWNVRNKTTERVKRSSLPEKEIYPQERQDDAETTLEYIHNPEWEVCSEDTCSENGLQSIKTRCSEAQSNEGTSEQDEDGTKTDTNIKVVPLSKMKTRHRKHKFPQDPLRHTRAVRPLPSAHSCSGLVALELRRLRAEQQRDRRTHARDMEALRVELQRVEAQRRHTDVLQQLVTVAHKAYELLQARLL